ncbi:helix-turn-helix domain-containing protein [Escherichia coli]|uniref:helix-turn-helix domain-containing protein n=1 Tax=Escherichia coli TaxID=562 RepID=UPI001ADCEE47|nr:helix-turn-helix domain-containing protein [Escherichia coli]MBO9236536.1 helix-turn-helix domain-containing protein [Escherichia coli]
MVAPVKYTDKRAGLILDALKEGYSLREIADMPSVGIDRTTINNWRQRYPEFNDAITWIQTTNAIDHWETALEQTEKAIRVAHLDGDTRLECAMLMKAAEINIRLGELKLKLRKPGWLENDE